MILNQLDCQLDGEKRRELELGKRTGFKQQLSTHRRLAHASSPDDH